MHGADSVEGIQTSDTGVAEEKIVVGSWWQGYTAYRLLGIVVSKLRPAMIYD